MKEDDMKRGKYALVSFFLVIGLSLMLFTTTKVLGCTGYMGSMMNKMMGMMGRMMGHGKQSQQMDQAQMCPMMGKMPVVGIKPEELPEHESRAAKLYGNYCSQCHALPSPKAHSAREWEESFAKMDARMQMMGSMKMNEMCMMMNIQVPNEEEKRLILSYLKENGLEEIARDQLPSVDTEGAKLFENTCTQCHALPNPFLHTAQEWPEVVERMRKNMKLMGKRIISEQEKKIISDYLSGNSKEMGSSMPADEHKSSLKSTQRCCYLSPF